MDEWSIVTYYERGADPSAKYVERFLVKALTYREGDVLDKHLVEPELVQFALEQAGFQGVKAWTTGPK